MKKSTNKSRRSLSEPPETIQIIGNPCEMGTEPVIREMTLDDIEDDCPLCQAMREEILAGNPPEVMIFE